MVVKSYINPVLTGITLLLFFLSLCVGSQGWQWPQADDWIWIEQLRAPRAVGAALCGALLGLSGALAQGLFRNPLADPYLLGSAAGAGLGVVSVLAAAGVLGLQVWAGVSSWLTSLGTVSAAFCGALTGVGLTLLLAGGTHRPMILLLCGVVVGVLLTALTQLLVLLSPEALRGQQMFLLGQTTFLSWHSVILLAVALAVCLPLSLGLARALDALSLGEDTARSLGVPLKATRRILIVLMAVCTGAAVSQAGLLAFVGLVAPHAVRRMVHVTHGRLLWLSAWAGGILMLGADLTARWVWAPQELPVGIVTAVFGACYLLGLLRKKNSVSHAI
jgi:iron complex transport system permease protein